MINKNYMNKQIFKYPLKPSDVNLISMPADAQVLTVQVQNETPCMWALLDKEKEKVERIFELFMTGANIPYDMGVERKYINTFQMPQGLVLHLFERIN